MNEDIKQWFIEKVAQNPEYLARNYIPAIERSIERAMSARDQALRKDGIEKIKYHMGVLDGVREVFALLEGLKSSEGKKSPEPGLMARIFPQGWSENRDVPSRMG